MSTMSNYREGAEKFASRPCLGWRQKMDAEGKVLGPYTFMTYKEAWERSVKVRVWQHQAVLAKCIVTS